KQTSAASASSLASWLKSSDENPTTTRPRSLYFRYAASRPLNCGVNPQWLAVFTRSIGLPATSLHRFASSDELSLRKSLLMEGRAGLRGGSARDRGDLRDRRHLRQRRHADNGHDATKLHREILAVGPGMAPYRRPVYTARPYRYGLRNLPDPPCAEPSESEPS